MQIKEAEAWKSGALEQRGVQIAALEHGKLGGRHLAAIRFQLAIERLADGVEIFVTLRASQDRDDLIFDRGQAPLEIFERAEVRGRSRAPDFRVSRRFRAARLAGRPRNK